MASFATWSIREYRGRMMENMRSEAQENFHGLSSPPLRPRPQKRACFECHVRKVRCDGAVRGLPCTNCRSARVDCVVAERRKRRRKTAVTTKPARDQEALMSDDSSPLTRNAVGGDSTADASDGKSNDARHEGECELAKQHLVEFFNQDLQYNPIRARCTYVGTELSNLNYLIRERTVDHHVYHYPCSQIYVPRIFRNSQPPATPNLIPKDAFVLPPKHVADVLVADFFEHIYPAFPIVDKESFVAQLKQPHPSPSILLQQAVFLAASHVTKVHKNTHELKSAFFRRAKALMDGKYEVDRMNVVQAALLLTWFSDGGDDICANAWHWIGVASRTAIGLGMHRDVLPSKMPERDKRLWRRIWWAVLQFDCLVSLSYGRPQTINLDDCDVPPLCPEDFAGTLDPTEANFVMQHASLCVIITDLVRNYFSVRATRSGPSRKEAMEAVDRVLAKWLTELPPDLCTRSSQTSSKGGSKTNIWRSLLFMTYNTALMQFHRHRPFEARDVDNAVEASDSEICTEAASSLIQIFDDLQQLDLLGRCWFSAPSSLFTAMLQISGELKSSNPILTLRYKEKYDSGLYCLKKLSKHWLYATSIFHLFQNSFSKPRHATSAATTSGGPPAMIPEQVSPELESPTTTSSTGAPVPGSHVMEHHPQNGNMQEMNWMQLFSLGDANTSNINMEQNRWLTSINDWQSLYWSDPLANMRLDDNFGDLQFDWTR